MKKKKKKEKKKKRAKAREKQEKKEESGFKLTTSSYHPSIHAPKTTELPTSATTMSSGQQAAAAKLSSCTHKRERKREGAPLEEETRQIKIRKRKQMAASANGLSPER